LRRGRDVVSVTSAVVKANVDVGSGLRTWIGLRNTTMKVASYEGHRVQTQSGFWSSKYASYTSVTAAHFGKSETVDRTDEMSQRLDTGADLDGEHVKFNNGRRER